jgi:hypothetical protein
MHVHVWIQRWVRWWAYLGIVCGTVALANIFVRDLSRTQDKVILLTGVAHWVLGGVVCYACDGIRIQVPKQSRADKPMPACEVQEWHAASDFLLPGNRKSLLPPHH